FFLTASVSYYWGLKEERTAKSESTKAGMAVALIILMCLGGYIFVEVFPWNLWTNLQAYRFLIIMKWLGYIFIGATMAKFIFGRSSLEGSLPGWLMLVASGREVPLSLAWGHLVEMFRRYLSPRLSGPVFNYILGATILVGALSLFWAGTVSEELIKVILFVLVSLWFMANRRIWLRISVPLGLVVVLLVVSLLFPKLPLVGTRLGWTYTHDTADFRSVSQYAAENTPREALFLVPPMFGEFRYTARRSLVVDFKCISWQYEAISAWYNRMIDCYGQVKTGGWQATQALDTNYRRITPEKILQIVGKYGATHAILYTGTFFPEPAVYENETYKVIDLREIKP
ncbi:MAG: hypothetical protein MI702_11130, partial [Chlorobiales bacterium]|nr:hypothetical protein [Chlorobiales bacterium]